MWIKNTLESVAFDQVDSINLNGIYGMAFYFIA